MTEVELPPHPHPSINRPTAKAKASLFILAPCPASQRAYRSRRRGIARMLCFKKTATRYSDFAEDVGNCPEQVLDAFLRALSRQGAKI